MTDSIGPDAGQTRPATDVAARANELYWHSDESVNQIARSLDLSKGMLYEIVVPLGAEISCPHDCGELVWSNRTARDRGFVGCTGCGFEDEEDQVRTLLELRQDLEGTELGAVPPTEPEERRAIVLDPPSLRLETLLGIAALTGLAAGLVLGGFFRRR